MEDFSYYDCHRKYADTASALDCECCEHSFFDLIFGVVIGGVAGLILGICLSAIHFINS